MCRLNWIYIVCIWHIAQHVKELKRDSPKLCQWQFLNQKGSNPLIFLVIANIREHTGHKLCLHLILPSQEGANNGIIILNSLYSYFVRVIVLVSRRDLIECVQ